MAGGDEHKGKAAIEDWLASRLASLGDDESDEVSAEVLPADDDQETQVEPTAVADEEPPPSEATLEWPELRTPELPEPVARLRTPAPPPSRAPDPFAAIPAFDLDSQVFPAAEEPPLDEADTDPTRDPAELDLPPPPPEDPVRWGGDGDTAPIPRFDDEPSQPEISDPGPAATLPARFGAREPELEDLEELEPDDHGNFDEVFPVARALSAAPSRRREETNTNVLLQVTQTAFAPTPPPKRAASAPEPVEPSEPGTSWYEGPRAPAPRSLHEEKTEIRGFSPSVSTFEDDVDDSPTVIVPPRPPVAFEPPPTPRPAPTAAGAPRPPDDASHATVLAWTATSFGVLLFGSLVVIGLLIAARYLQLQG